MNNQRRWILSVVVLVAAVIALWLSWGREEESRSFEGRLAARAAVDPSGFARAEGPQPFNFPQDHGPHPDYQTEWWYFTGNLDTADGQHFGFQLTFFRRAMLPADQSPDRTSDWGTRQVYMAHFALTNVTGREFYADERLQRGAAGLAGAQVMPFAVWLEDWRVEALGDDRYRIVADTIDPQTGLRYGLDLALVDRKGPVLQGDQGYSQKGPERGNASYYYSLTRLESSGSVQVGERKYNVQGLSWMDHEYSTSALSANQLGWDWFSIQLNDGSELMVFQIRQAGKSPGDPEQIDPFSSGTLVQPDGTTTRLSKDDFRIQINDTWTSPVSEATYPAGWTVEVPIAGMRLVVEPYLADQELNVSYDYWEGAVQVDGISNGQPVNGSGYVELTGYSRAMGGEF